MKDEGILIGSSTLRFERLLKGPIERVWKYLTDSELRGQWLASGEMELRPGGTLTFYFDHDALSDEPNPLPEKYQELECVSKGKILAFDKPNLLSFSWGSEGIVTITLREEGNMVHLALTHEKLGADKETRIGTLAGWHTHLNILRDRLEEKPPKAFWPVHVPLEEDYANKLGY